tara:strand:+ start:87 stop:818 length:732 start_codon:yes stop_codon:yes gene_type:complete
MSNQTLCELAKDYARGEIDKESYRKSRVELITAITTGKVVVKAIDFPPPLIPSEEEAAITETAKREKTKIVSPSPKQTPSSKGRSPKPQPTTKTDKKSPMLFITISVAIVITLIIVVILFYPKPPGSTTTETSNVSDMTQAPTSTVAKNMAGESLISEFLTQKNWTEDSLNAFLNAWSALSQEERDLTKSTKRMQRMNASIYKQFLEEKALSSIDSEKAAMKQQKLIEFANAIGINDSRLILE